MAGALEAAGAAVKASGAIAAPFMLVGTRQRLRFLLGAASVVLGTAITTVAVFGFTALDSFVLIGQNQERTTRWSVPQRLADGIAGLTGGSASSIVHVTRGLLVVALALTVVWLLRWAWRRRATPLAWVTAAGWATLAVLLATAWLVPWYAVWLLPFAAVSRSRYLMAATIALCAYMLVIAVPL
jgi:hypothetical protein